MKLRQYILFNKPYGVLSQFTPSSNWRTLRDYGPFPSEVYPVGRLDADSEGLLLLTDDTAARHRLMDPRFGHPKTYLVQVERIPNSTALSQLSDGLLIQGHVTKQATVRRLKATPELHDRPVPIRYRKNVPTCWLEITLAEGRNRQVRRMTAAVGHPTLRLVRIRIGELEIGTLGVGESRNLTTEEVQSLRQKLGLQESQGERIRSRKRRR